MDGSPVLRAQGQNEIRDYIRRVKNDNNRMPQDPRNSKLVHTQSHSSHNSENQGPERQPPLRQSRLPVLVKSKQTFHASQWEENLLPGKAKKRKSCTRPVPFNKSYTQKLKGLKSQVVPQPKSGAHFTRAPNSKPPKCLAVTAKDKCRSHGTLSGNSDPKNVTQHRDAFSSSSSACLDGLTHLSLKDPTESSCPNKNVQDKLSSGPYDEAERFRPINAALPSILGNKGARVSCQPFPTPNSQSRGMFPQSGSKIQKAAPKTECHIHTSLQNSTGKGTFPQTPQRVPIKKNLTVADKAVHFQPDPSSLLSILCNEGVHVSSQSSSQSYSMFPQRMSVAKSHEKAAPRQKTWAAGPIRATPRDPVAREAYLDTPQRMSVAKSHEKAASRQKTWTAGPMRATPRDPVAREAYLDTPQRVPVKKNLSVAGSTHKKTKNFQSLPKPSSPSPAMKVVQTLFVHQEDGETPNKEKEVHPQLQATPIKDKVKTTTISGDEDEHGNYEAQPPRESVIFFSTGKKQLRFERQENSAHRVLPDKEPSELVQVDQPASRVDPAGRALHREKKTCVTDTTLTMLSKLRTDVEDQRLDQEVAFYISRSLSGAPVSQHSQARCRDPVASLLHFEESIKFIPLCLEAPSPSSSPLKE